MKPDVIQSPRHALILTESSDFVKMPFAEIPVTKQGFIQPGRYFLIYDLAHSSQETALLYWDRRQSQFSTKEVPHVTGLPVLLNHSGIAKSRR